MRVGLAADVTCTAVIPCTFVGQDIYLNAARTGGQCIGHTGARESFIRSATHKGRMVTARLCAVCGLEEGDRSGGEGGG